MFVRSRLKLWLSSLHQHYPASSLSQQPSLARLSFDVLPVTVVRHTRCLFSPSPRIVWPPGLLLFTVCCSMLSETPEWWAGARRYRPCPCCLRLPPKLRPTQIQNLTGLTTRFSVLRFTSQPLFHSVFLQPP